MTQFCPPGESVSLSGIVSSSSTRPDPTRVTRPSSNNYLQSAFAAQSKGGSSDVWIGDRGALGHTTNGASKTYCVRPPLPDQREVTTSDGASLRVECVGSIDVGFHGRSDKPITLCDVSYVLELRFNLFSFHKAQQTHVIILDAAGAHIAGKNITFLCEKRGSYLRASRFAPGTVGAKRRTNRALTSQISASLSSRVPFCPPNVPNSSRFSGASKVSGTDAAYDDLLGPIPSAPISSVLGGIEFGRKPLFESDCSLSAAALNPGMLKHSKVVDIYISMPLSPMPIRFSFDWRIGFVFGMFGG